MARTSLVDDPALAEEDDFGDGSFQLDISGISGFGADIDNTNDTFSFANSQTLSPLHPSHQNSKISGKNSSGSKGPPNFPIDRKQSKVKNAIPLEDIMEQDDDDLPDFNSADELMSKPLPSINDIPPQKNGFDAVPMTSPQNSIAKTQSTGFDPIPIPEQPKAEPPKPSVSNFDAVPMNNNTNNVKQETQDNNIPTPEIPAPTTTRRLLTGGILSRKNLLSQPSAPETKPEPKDDDPFGGIPFPAIPGVDDKPPEKPAVVQPQPQNPPQNVMINQNNQMTQPPMQNMPQQNQMMQNPMQMQMNMQQNQNQMQMNMQQNQPQMNMAAPMQQMGMQMPPQQQNPQNMQQSPMPMMQTPNQQIPMQQAPQQFQMMQNNAPLQIQIPQQPNQFSPNGSPYGQPYYSPAQPVGYYNNGQSPTPYSGYSYSVQFPLESGFSSSLDRTIANFKRIFSSEFSSIIRTQNLQQSNAFDFDDFTDKLSTEIAQIIEAPIPPADIDSQNISRKVSTAIDENTKHVTTILSEAEMRNSQSAEHHIKELKQLQEELDHLRTSFKSSSDTIIRELERERQNSAAIREGENNRARELEQRLRALKLRQIELDTRYKNQALEKDSFERSAKAFEQKRREWEEETLPKLYDDNSSVRRRIIDELSAFRTEVSTESFDELSMVINEGLKIIKDEGESLRNELMELEMANRWIMSRQAPPPPQKRSPKRMKKSSVLDQTQEKLSKIRRQRAESMRDLSDQL